MCYANAAGKHGLKLVVIRKSKKSRSFEKTKGTNLPIKYYSQHPTCMDRTIFRLWFHDEFISEVKTSKKEFKETKFAAKSRVSNRQQPTSSSRR